MNTPRHLRSGLLLAALLILGACSKERPSTPVVTQPSPSAQNSSGTPAVTVTPVTPADPSVEMKAALEKATLDQHEGLTGLQQRMDQEIDAQVAARKAAGADVSVIVDGKLDSATADFAEKLRMLSLARPETWNTAKHDAELSLQSVRDAFAQVMNSPQRK